MNEREALKQMSRVCDMVILCIDAKDTENAQKYAEDLHEAYREWFSAWRNNEYNQHR